MRINSPVASHLTLNKKKAKVITKHPPPRQGPAQSASLPSHSLIASLPFMPHLHSLLLIPLEFFLKHGEHPPTPGPLHWLLPFPGMFFSSISHCSFSSPSRIFSNVAFSLKTSQATFSKMSPPPQHTNGTLFPPVRFFSSTML